MQGCGRQALVVGTYRFSWLLLLPALCIDWESNLLLEQSVTFGPKAVRLSTFGYNFLQLHF